VGVVVLAKDVPNPGGERPELGPDGAAQHVVGVRARSLIPVNTDRAAPIFQLADIGVVGDARAIAQALVAELEAVGAH
jgi:electron transfer flavoprotein alpha subunit